MANIISVINDQIRRLARREITAQTKTLRKLNAGHRRDIAALKRQMAAMAKAVGFLERQEKRRVGEQPAIAPEAEGLRFRADGLRSHRAKLGLSAALYGKLVGVTGQTIYDWEAGTSRPRQQQVARVAAVRGIGKREALKRLELLGEAVGQVVGKGRRTGGPTAQEFILGLVQSSKGISSAQINQAWQKDGRPGKADNTLTLLVKAGRLKRTKIKGQRGSTYR